MDRNVFRLVILFLGVTLLGSVLGIVVLALADNDVPTILEQVVVGALTGIAGLLARSPGAEEPTPVQVVNPASDPVPTDPQTGAGGYGAPV